MSSTDHLVESFVRSLTSYRELSKDPQRIVELLGQPSSRLQVLRFTTLPADIQHDVARSGDLDSLRALATNPTIDDDVAEILYLHGRPVWYALAEHTRCTSIQEQLSLDVETWEHLAQNPRLAPHVQRTVLQDRETWEHLALGDELAEDVEAVLATDVRCHPYLTHSETIRPSTQILIAQGSDELAHKELARNHALTPQAATALVHQGTYGALYELARREGVNDADRPAWVVAQGEPRRAEQILQELDADLEACEALLPNWHGTFGELAEASRLVTNSQARNVLPDGA